MRFTSIRVLYFIQINRLFYFDVIVPISGSCPENFVTPPFGKMTGFELPVLRGELGRKLAISPITETESMGKFSPNALWLKGRESRHQLQINGEN